MASTKISLLLIIFAKNITIAMFIVFCTSTTDGFPYFLTYTATLHSDDMFTAGPHCRSKLPEAHV